MKYTIFFIFLIYSQLLPAQDNSSLFNNQVVLEEGVYTSLSEILENSPKYYGYQFEYSVSYWTGQSVMYYFDESGGRHKFEDTIVMIVEDGARYVKYNHQFCKLILTGAISTFYIETTYQYANGQNRVDTQLYFCDIQTGVMDKLNHKGLGEILKRDSHIYSTYSAISDSQKKKTLYSYVLKFNSRNPVFIKNQ